MMLMAQRAGDGESRRMRCKAVSLQSGIPEVSKGLRVTPLKVTSDCASSKQGGTADFFVPEALICLRDFLFFIFLYFYITDIKAA